MIDNGAVSLLTGSMEGQGSGPVSIPMLYRMWLSFAGYIANNSSDSDPEERKAKNFCAAILRSLQIENAMAVASKPVEDFPAPPAPVEVPDSGQAFMREDLAYYEEQIQEIRGIYEDDTEKADKAVAMLEAKAALLRRALEQAKTAMTAAGDDKMKQAVAEGTAFFMSESLKPSVAELMLPARPVREDKAAALESTADALLSAAKSLKAVGEQLEPHYTVDNHGFGAPDHEED